jgi:hypothetical protein
MFNTLKYAKMMEEVGFSRTQAETSVKILVEIMEDNLASKQDLVDLTAITRQDLKDLEFRMTVRMGTMLAATIGILTAIQKLT